MIVYKNKIPTMLQSTPTKNPISTSDRVCCRSTIRDVPNTPANNRKAQSHFTGL